MVRLDEGGRAAREVLLLPPRPSLRTRVRHVSIQPGPTRHRGAPWRVVPDNCGHVIYSVTRDGRSRCRIVGSRSRYADIDVDGRILTIAVRLRPGVLPALLRDDARAATDRAIDAADLFGSRVSRRIVDADPLDPRAVADTMADVLETWLGRQAGTPVEIALACARRVEDLGDAFGTRSSRALHARMLATVGLAPKRALRIQRLHAALRHTAGDASLAGAAAAAGFSDQAHFTRECRALLGEPPSVWLRRADSFKPRP